MRINKSGLIARTKKRKNKEKERSLLLNENGIGRAISQAVSRWLSPAATRVRARV
jgi:hypothetical protein